MTFHWCYAQPPQFTEAISTARHIKNNQVSERADVRKAAQSLVESVVQGFPDLNL